jgi:hypothetical protein
VFPDHASTCSCTFLTCAQASLLAGSFRLRSGVGTLDLGQRVITGTGLPHTLVEKPEIAA